MCYRYILIITFLGYANIKRKRYIVNVSSKRPILTYCLKE